MNVDRMRAVADLIELEDRFDYGRWVTGPRGAGRGDAKSADLLGECGTTGCVAGWAAYLGRREGFKCDAYLIEDFAAEYLELPPGWARWLFRGGPFRDDPDRAWSDTSAVEVAKMLRHLADREQVSQQSPSFTLGDGDGPRPTPPPSGEPQLPAPCLPVEPGRAGTVNPEWIGRRIVEAAA